MSLPKVLLTNDDGIGAPPLVLLRDALAEVAKVWVVAPDRERSAASHALTLHKPLRLTPQRLNGTDLGHCVNGTPADCVFLGVKTLIPGGPDFVVSGINAGGNLGNDITYSGTVSAAMEGTLLGIRSMSVSVASSPIRNVKLAVRWSRRIFEWALAWPWPKNTLLNVNIPNVDRAAKIKGVRVTRQSEASYEGILAKRHDLRRRPYYWIGGRRRYEGIEPGTDLWAVRRGYVSVTPIQLDMTDRHALEVLKESNLETIR